MKHKKEIHFQVLWKTKVDNPALDAPDGITVEGNPAWYSKMLKWDLQ